MKKFTSGISFVKRSASGSSLGGHQDSLGRFKGSFNRIKTALAGPTSSHIGDAPDVSLPPVLGPAMILTEQDASLSLQPSSAAAVTEATAVPKPTPHSMASPRIWDIPSCTLPHPPDANRTSMSDVTSLDADARAHPYLIDAPDSMAFDDHLEVIRLDDNPTHAYLNSAAHMAAVAQQPLASLPGAAPDASPLHSPSTRSCQSTPKHALRSDPITRVPEKRLARFRDETQVECEPSFQRSSISGVWRALWSSFSVLGPPPDLCLDDLPYMQHNALKVLSRNSPLRRACVLITLSGGFELILMTLILFTCVLLTLESPRLDEHSAQHRFIQQTDLIVTCLFTCETLLKIIARGFIMHEEAYLRSPSDVLDFVIVTSALFSLVMKDVDASPLKVLRVMRALRPLKMVFRDEGMQVVVKSLWMAAPSVLYLVIFGFILTYIFAIIGVQLFAAQFDYCNDDAVSSKADCLSQSTYWDSDRGELVPRLWIMPLFNFDSVPRAISTLMVVTMMDGWETIMFQAMDRAGEDKQPVKNNQSWSAAYFLLFVFFSGMVWFNIFVGVVVNTYTTMQVLHPTFYLCTAAPRLASYIPAERIMYSMSFQDKQSRKVCKATATFVLVCPQREIRLTCVTSGHTADALWVPASDDGMTLVTKGQKQLEMSLKMQTWKSSMEWLNDVPESMTPP
ncbi:hypothetical protein CYMTET_14902 [Cymbomonas tetramitiformis]|uniref:Ion transport domain-containing protein n=1 Tax=Cymbomonas tetramitiformis TaxID=36881 RepID=A0AAE0GFF5_9CHLO|nr:hypothetical protein CYMTET_14902 [Cymbomonas tetramitiformis]